ncbi:MAG: restriction endonuclease subunit S [Nitrospira sp.]|nr:restriction endonuclease subunit S [Nitrospira sp.]
MAPFEIIDGDRGKSYPKQWDFSDSGHCVFLNATNVTRNGFEFSECQFISEQKDNQLRKGKLQRDDIVLTTRGTIGNVAHFKASVPFEQMRINSGMVILRCDPNKILPTYLYHFLRSPSFHGQVNSLRSGVAQPQLPIRDMKRIKIPLPNLTEQRRIASILSAYDDLIENNRRRIRLLEKAARLLYKEWFVHFRFPGHECITVTNGVPDGWKKEKVSAHVDFVRGVEPGSKNYMQVSDEMLVPFLRVGDFGNRISNIFIDATFAEGKMLKSEDVAITMDGTPGLVGFGMTGAFSSGIRKVVPKDNCGIGWSFIYTLLKSESIQATVARFAKGTTILHASSSIDHMVFLQPHQGILGVFEDVTGSLLRQVLLLDQQNRKLVKARDLLLPRLMNGAVTV